MLAEYDAEVKHENEITLRLKRKRKKIANQITYYVSNALGRQFEFNLFRILTQVQDNEV